MAEYPEHEKLSKISDKSQAIGEFLEWLKSVGIQPCRQEDRPGVLEDRWWPVNTPVTHLLARYFEIDLDVIEDEKRHMLDAMREANASNQ